MGEICVILTTVLSNDVLQLLASVYVSSGSPWSEPFPEFSCSGSPEME